jgi:hypothetical protein
VRLVWRLIRGVNVAQSHRRGSNGQKAIRRVNEGQCANEGGLSMQAIVMTRFGPPEVLQLQEVQQPVPKENEVLTRVRATTVFAADCELRGLRILLALRLPFWIYMRFFRPKPIILGR